MNDVLCSAANQAIGALSFLDSIGASVVSIEIRSHRPRVILDAAPGGMVKGAIRMTRRMGSYREHVMVAMVQGCQVEWLVRMVRSDAALERA